MAVGKRNHMTGAQAAGLPTREADSAAASAVKALQAEGRHAEARERYAELVARHQRRAARIAFHYLRDAAEADEAVQDALVKAYSHLSSFREELPFEVWFTRILINGCLDRIKARTRRERWLVPMPESPVGQRDFTERVAARRTVAGGSAARPRAAAETGRGAGAVARAAALGVHVEPLSRAARRARSARMTGLNESTVRVHLFRAIRRLRTLLAEDAREHRGAGRKAPCHFLIDIAATRHLSDDAVRGSVEHRGHDGSAGRRPAPVRRAQCRTRYADFTGWLDRIQDDALAEADEAFPPERLAAQQAQIMRRLEAAGTSGARHRVPRFSRPVTSTQGHAQRWVAAAAAAGLVIGLVAGQLFDVRHLLSTPARAGGGADRRA